MQDRIPTLQDVVEAQSRVAIAAVHTPLLHRVVEGRAVSFKAEVLQTTGSFKIRGALNVVGSLDAEERARGVVAYSSGNHAQGVAAAAAHLGTTATIVMPRDAPAIKLANTRALGADVVTYDRATESREEIAAAIAAERSATIVPPFDHPLTIAGQGTVGLEIIEDLGDAGVDAATVVVPASGGGLAAGIALAGDGDGPRLGVMTAEPDTHDDHARSLEIGERVRVEDPPPSICDALLQPEPGEITFAVNRHRLVGAVTASEDEVLAAMRWAFECLKLVVEPGGAVALAALLAGRIPGDGRVVVVLSGGNVDPAMMARALR